jgi:hypothetical protein
VASVWRCDICEVTITTRGDGRAEACHLAGKPHLKKLRALGLAPKAEPRQPAEQTSSASVDPSLRCADASTNSKSVLNELCQQRQWKLRYEVESQQGPNHAPEYTIRVVIERTGQPAEHFVGTGAPNKRIAEATAATEALRRLLHEGISYEPEKNTGKGGCGHASRGHLRWSLGCAQHPDDVFRVISAELPRGTLQPEHYACAWNRLAKLSREAGRPLPASDNRVASLLHATVQRLTAADAAGLPSGSSVPVPVALLPWGAREVANVAHGVTVALGLPHGGERDASASFGRAATALFDTCVLRALELMHTIKPQELSNFAWALGKAAHHAPAFLDAAARIATSWLEADFAEAAAKAATEAATEAAAEAATEAAAVREPVRAAADEAQSKRRKLDMPMASAAPIASAPAAHAATPPSAAPTTLPVVGGPRMGWHGAPIVGGPGAAAAASAAAEVLGTALGLGPGAATSAVPSSAVVSASPNRPHKEGHKEGHEEGHAARYEPRGVHGHAPVAATTAAAAAATAAAAAAAAAASAAGEEEDREDREDEEEDREGSTFLPQELSNLLYSYGRAAHAAPSLFAAAAAPVSSAWLAGERTLDGWSVQDVANTLWACAAADARHEHLVAALETALCTRGFALQQAHYTQIQQYLIWWEIELGRRAPLVTPALREQCRRCLAAGDVKSGHRVSALQLAVGRCLERLGLISQSELTTDEGYSIDLAVLRERVAIEVDGPSHFTQVGTPSGATLLKRRQLRATGWNVVAIPYFEWYRLDRNVQREDEYLCRLLQPYASRRTEAIGR